jgi:hypothetical protein
MSWSLKAFSTSEPSHVEFVAQLHQPLATFTGGKVGIKSHIVDVVGGQLLADARHVAVVADDRVDGADFLVTVLISH